ncbi:carboxymuconolactone decarboxylase family protein [Streptomyces spiralis]|uniref:carboxymuconolactone decarboxylase family protein n=1 Tax=Streptomyces spiralis TaxID=66376 RepID=UPI0033F7423B
MARIAPAPGHPLDELDTLDQHERIAATIASILAHRPAIARVLHEQYRDALAAEGTLPPRLVELVRLRLAFHNQCRTCMAVRHRSGVEAGVTEKLVCSLERPAEAPDLTDAERSALHYADLLATDHLAIDDAVYDDLRRHFDEGEIVELGMRCARTIGLGRLNATWHNVEHLPERFRATEGAVAPWGGDALTW